MTADDAEGPALARLLITGRPPIELAMPITIGREPRSDSGEVVAVGEDPLVSKSHLSIDRDAEGFVITDLGSSNGTFLHHAGWETAVPTGSWIPIPPGAEVEFGDQRMIIDTSAAADASSIDEDATPRHGTVAPVSSGAPADPWRAVGDVDTSPMCANCGRRLAVDSNFCDRCGRPTSSSAALSVPHPGGREGSAPRTGFDSGAPAVARPGADAASIEPPSTPAPPASADLSRSSRSPARRWKIFLAVVGASLVLGALARVLGGGETEGRGTGLGLVPATADGLLTGSNQIWTGACPSPRHDFHDGDDIHGVDLG